VRAGWIRTWRCDKSKNGLWSLASESRLSVDHLDGQIKWTTRPRVSCALSSR